MCEFFFFSFFQWVMETFSFVIFLVFNKFCIFILNLSVICLLAVVKKKKSYKNLKYFITNISKKKEREIEINFFRL